MPGEEIGSSLASEKTIRNSIDVGDHMPPLKVVLAILAFLALLLILALVIYLILGPIPYTP